MPKGIDTVLIVSFRTTKIYVCDVYLYRETIPKVGKMKTLSYGANDRESSSGYFKIFPTLLGAQLIEIEQFEKSNFREKCGRSCENSTKVYYVNVRVNPGCMVRIKAEPHIRLFSENSREH